MTLPHRPEKRKARKAELLRERAEHGVAIGKIDLELAKLEEATVDEPVGYTQHRRPAWATTPNQFLREWHKLHNEGHPGAQQRGKIRILSDEASELVLARGNAKGTPRKAPAAPQSEPRSLADEVLAELGGKRTG